MKKLLEWVGILVPRSHSFLYVVHKSQSFWSLFNTVVNRDILFHMFMYLNLSINASCFVGALSYVFDFLSLMTVGEGPEFVTHVFRQRFVYQKSFYSGCRCFSCVLSGAIRTLLQRSSSADRGKTSAAISGTQIGISKVCEATSTVCC